MATLTAEILGNYKNNVDHMILLAKLNHYGISGVSNDWFKSHVLTVFGFDFRLTAKVPLRFCSMTPFTFLLCFLYKTFLCIYIYIYPVICLKTNKISLNLKKLKWQSLNLSKRNWNLTWIYLYVVKTISYWKC